MIFAIVGPRPSTTTKPRLIDTGGANATLSSFLGFLPSIWQVEALPILQGGGEGPGADSFDSKKVWSSFLILDLCPLPLLKHTVYE